MGFLLERAGNSVLRMKDENDFPLKNLGRVTTDMYIL